jgi:hypothetical protein
MYNQSKKLWNNRITSFTQRPETATAVQLKLFTTIMSDKEFEDGDNYDTDDEDDEYDPDASGLEVPKLDDANDLTLDAHLPSSDTMDIESPSELKLLDSIYGAQNEKDNDPTKHIHRITFNKLAFGYDEKGNLKEKSKRSKKWPDTKYNSTIAILSKWNHPDKAFRMRFRNKFRKGYDLAKQLHESL